MKKTDPYFGVVVIGGILGGYAVTAFHGMFASAQTANLIALMNLLVGKDLIDALWRIGSLLVFMAGIAGSELIKLKGTWNLERIAVTLDIAVAFWMAFGPLSTNTIVSLYPIWFTAAFQWNVFEGTKEYKSSCIFSTNNLKQFTLAWIHYLCSGEIAHKQRAIHFGKVLISFLGGVLAACIGYSILGRMTVLLVILPGLWVYRAFSCEEALVLQEKVQ